MVARRDLGDDETAISASQGMPKHKTPIMTFEAMSYFGGDRLPEKACSRNLVLC